jgi:hypothetical protein
MNERKKKRKKLFFLSGGARTFIFVLLPSAAGLAQSQLSQLLLLSDNS